MSITNEQLGGLSLDEMRSILKDLQEARFSGASRIRFRERDVTFKSDAEMARIEAELIRRIKECVTKKRGRKHVGFATYGDGR